MGWYGSIGRWVEPFTIRSDTISAVMGASRMPLRKCPLNVLRRGVGSSILTGLFFVPLVGASRSPFAETWERKMNKLPGVDLTIHEFAGGIGSEFRY